MPSTSSWRMGLTLPRSEVRKHINVSGSIEHRPFWSVGELPLGGDVSRGSIGNPVELLPFFFRVRTTPKVVGGHKSPVLMSTEASHEH